MTTLLTPRGAAIQRAVGARELHRRLARQYAEVAPTGRMLALAVRVARSLERSGVPREQLVEATEGLVHRVMAARMMPELLTASTPHVGTRP